MKKLSRMQQQMVSYVSKYSSAEELKEKEFGKYSIMARHNLLSVAFPPTTPAKEPKHLDPKLLEIAKADALSTTAFIMSELHKATSTITASPTASEVKQSLRDFKKAIKKTLKDL